MLQQRICRQCDRSFDGGPRAFYCPECREMRRLEYDRIYKQKLRAGYIGRPLGSIDKCERCGKDYIVDGGLQRFCSDCQPIHAQEHDRKTAIEFYHAHKDRINPVRYQRRRKPPKKCAWCGKEFTAGTRVLTCSPECRRKYTNKKHYEKYGKYRKERC